MMTFDELSCLPKECVKRVFQSEIARGSGVIKEVFCQYVFIQTLEYLLVVS